MADNSLINKKDYLIISNLGGDDADEVARVVEYINSNLDAWIAAVGEPAAYYVIEKNDERMLDLVKKGDESYKTYLEKIRTDYKKALRRDQVQDRHALPEVRRLLRCTLRYLQE